jgi:hypothetical protein
MKRCRTVNRGHVRRLNLALFQLNSVYSSPTTVVYQVSSHSRVTLPLASFPSHLGSLTVINSHSESPPTEKNYARRCLCHQPCLDYKGKADRTASCVLHRNGTMMEPATQGCSIPGRTGDQSAANGGGVLMANRRRGAFGMDTLVWHSSG